MPTLQFLQYWVINLDSVLLGIREGFNLGKNVWNIGFIHSWSKLVKFTPFWCKILYRLCCKLPYFPGSANPKHKWIIIISTRLDWNLPLHRNNFQILVCQVFIDKIQISNKMIIAEDFRLHPSSHFDVSISSSRQSFSSDQTILNISQISSHFHNTVRKPCFLKSVLTHITHIWFPY